MKQELEKNNIVNLVTESTEEEIDLLELFFYLKSKVVSLVAALLAGLLVAGSFTYFFVTPTYRASSYIYMVSASSGSVIDLSDLNLGTSVATDYQQLLLRRPVMENIIKELDGEIEVVEPNADEDTEETAENKSFITKVQEKILGKLGLMEADEDTDESEADLVLHDVSELAGYISLATVDNSRVLRIDVTTENPILSRDIANALAEQAVDYIPDIMNATAPTIAEYAVVPRKKAGPSIKKNALLGGLAAMVVCAGIYVVLYLLDDSIKSSEDIETTFGIVPLTVIPEGNITDLAEKAEDERRKHKKSKKAKKGA